jgi:prevent-host-death family protein
MSVTVPVSEARGHLPALIDRVKAGEEITLTRHGEPVALLVAPDSIRNRRAAGALDAAGHLAALLEDSRRAPLPEPSLGVAHAEALVEELRAERARS